ncbi:MAG: sigma-54 dependent transcriptional regulator [Spirochaetales bacterium]|uniref:Sigma-54 dependent transcriptional regulator n=1 Tax=Candidatus Thalassospirochaeta sargassi TaxID=3119039 RepID=A0AAJ1IBN2_9SPIO|nr:sigma-54 dependent transcriptional regulator [Spirochaetales bacterium]
MDKKDFRILLADDETGLLEGLSITLKLEGYSVDTVACGKDAVCALGKNWYDLAFLDLKLGDMDGIEVVKSIQPAITPIVIMTAYASVESAVSSMKMGVLDYIQKPFDNSDIISIADRFFDEKLDKAADVELSSEKFSRIIFKSKKSIEAYKTVDKVKNCDIPVLLLGESGTGKEVFARIMHENCERKDEPFVGINCSAIPAELLESELFGHEKGAFSGAAAEKPGKIESAGGGTLFLDEIGDMDFKLQSKLLRVLEEKTFERIGGLKPILFNARIIASTNRDIKKMINEKEFRSDLYFRLRGIEIELPPLRERPEDLEALIHQFVARFSESYKKNVSVSSEAVAALKDYSWPGNIRELRNVVETAVLLAEDHSLLLSDHFRLETKKTAVSEDAGHIDEMEKDFIIKALENNRFNRTLAAKELNISRKTLYNKIKKYSIE